MSRIQTKLVAQKYKLVWISALHCSLFFCFRKSEFPRGDMTFDDMIVYFKRMFNLTREEVSQLYKIDHQFLIVGDENMIKAFYARFSINPHPWIFIDVTIQ